MTECASSTAIRLSPSFTLLASFFEIPLQCIFVGAMRTSSVFSSLAVSALISHTLGQSCGSQQNPSINASDASASLDPFNLTAGPVKVDGADAATWTWTLATTSESASQSTSVEDRLWLDVQPPLDLTKPDFGYIGCGAILHGLTHETLLGGQNDDGSCSSVFSSDCIRALRNKTLEMAHEISSASTIIKPSNENSSASALCGFLEHLQPDDEPGLPAECAKSFNPGAWIETFGQFFQTRFLQPFSPVKELPH